ncbi:unnamed protein product [Kluyveromyces dobzhanskii CBS 2104]|uniref:WGS project CCBQ000000000 data, contig 00099 n=1 Tax=Kluyveromyces dobzhanskii CBS 2104 TaxID=1427455 RepID=A0A0A8L4U7_9SACH|nr:unnamed protein product [Kluyveromyces dobzhanskii CBS 2104]
MSNFFRDNSIGFKPRQNIFSKLRNVKDVESDESNGSSIMENPFFQRTEDSVKQSSPRDKPLPTKELIQSTPKSSPTKNQVCDEELEITEVREVPVSPQNPAALQKDANELPAANSSAVNVDNSSNDVLLEAFTNTQRICSNLKIELQKQQQKNTQQKDLIEKYKTEIVVVKENIHSHKNLLSALEEQIKVLKVNKLENYKSIKELSSSYKSLNEKVKLSISESEVLKTNFQQQKTIQKNLENAIQQKNRELDYKKKELDECSGQLSEEKIKYTELLQQLSSLKAEIVTGIKELLNTSDTSFGKRADILQNYFKTELQCVYENIKEGTSSAGKRVELSIGECTKNVAAELISVKELIRSSASSQTELVTQEAKQLTAVIPQIENILLEIQRVGSNNYSESKSFQESSFPSSIEHIIKTVNASTGNLQKLPDAIVSLGNKVTAAEIFESQITALNEKMHIALQQKTDMASMLKLKDHEIDEINNKLLLKNKELEEFSNTYSALQLDLSSVKESNELDKREFTKVQEENKAIITSLKSKLAAQSEISAILQKELNDSKNEIDTLNKKNSERSEEALVSKFEYESLQKQFQNVNIELVQAKAKELEFVEVNRNLKEQFDELESASSHTNSSFRKANDKVHTLEKEKSSLNLEKLDLIDKIEELESKLKRANIKNRPTAYFDPPKRKVNSTQTKPNEDDAFALSSDDLELTNPEYCSLTKPMETRRMPSKSAKGTRRKKLLLSDDLEESPKLKRTKRFR